MNRRRILLVFIALLLASCAGFGLREAPRVSVAGLDPLPGEGMEARFILKLRVQNPNEVALNFDGVVVDLELAGKDFASGVSDQHGNVPRYGESIVAVPVTVPATAIVRQMFSIATAGKPPGKFDYRLRGRIGSARFESQGVLELPSQSPR